MLGRTAGFGVKPLPFTPNEPDLAASRFFFIMTMILFLLILREATQSSLFAALLESSVHLILLSKLCLPGWTSAFFPLFWGPLKHLMRAPDGFLW